MKLRSAGLPASTLTCYPRFISVVIKHPDRVTFKGERVYFSSQFQVILITLGMSQQQDVETAYHITSTVKSREEWVHRCYFQLGFSTSMVQDPCPGSGAACNGLHHINWCYKDSLTDISTGQASVNRNSLRLFLQQILGCIKLIIKANLSSCQPSGILFFSGRVIYVYECFTWM